MRKRSWSGFRVSSGVDPLPDQQALFALSLGFAVSVSPHIEHVPWWLSLFTALLFAWRMTIMKRAAGIPGRLLRLLLLIGICVLLFRHYGTLLGRDAGVALLIGLSGLKYLEIRHFRDCMIVVFLSFLIALTSFLYSQSLLLGGYLLLVILILTAVMQYLNHSDHSRLPVMLRRSAVLVMLALPIGLVLFVFFPRVPLGLFGLPDDSHAGMTGMSDVIRPGSIHQLNESEETAFRVIFHGDVPPMKQRYWRGIMLGQYSDNSWRQHKTYLQTLRQPYPEPEPDDVLAYSLLLEPNNKRWVFALDMPVKRPAGLHWGRGQTLISTGPLLERKRFEMASSPRARFASISDAEYMRYTEVPEAVKNALGDISDSLYRQAGGPAEYIDRVLAYFHDEGFTYSLTPPVLTADVPMREFLLETRKGYCEHYASAFTLLMRLSGIPARLIAGYQGGEWNPQGEYLVVRQSDAHAWSEVWLDEQGWVRVDPTAVVAPERVEFGLDALRVLIAQGALPGSLDLEQIQTAITRPMLQMLWNRTLWFWDDLNTRWYLWVIGYDRDRQQGLLARLGLDALSGTGMMITAAGIITLIVLLQGVLLLRARRVRSDPVVQQYERFCRKLERIGLVRQPFEGPRDFARRVVAAQPEMGQNVDAIVDLYVNVHYAGEAHELIVKQLKDAVRAFRPVARAAGTGE